MKLFMIKALVVMILLSMTPSISHSLDANINDKRELEHPTNKLSRMLAGYNPRGSMTCDKFPRVCRARGSSGPDCCRKQCVDVTSDALNCGQCGMRCRYGETCCGGGCVRVMYDPQNCGGCRTRCRKGSLCRYGMCSYA